MSTSYRVVGAVAVITIDNPPVNGLGLSVRQGISRDLRRALDAPEIDAIVLTGSEKVFCGGADITEFGTPNACTAPSGATVIEELENATKPVVAAISGICLGGGLEMAMGAHYRVAQSAAKIGLPEVSLGLVPGAGGTQRLPRALGLETAAEMITSGAPRTARALAAVAGQRLLDLVVDVDLLDAAVEFALKAAKLSDRPRLQDLPVVGDAALLGALRSAISLKTPGFQAPLSALALVERAQSLPFEEGLAAERQVFQEVVAGTESKALRHAFFAQRAARKIPGMPADTQTRNIDKVAVIGAGTMGAGIAMAFLNSGIAVALLETAQEPLDRGLATIRRNYQSQVTRGRMAEEAMTARMAMLTPTIDYSDLADCDLAIEAVFEDMDVKRTVFKALDAVLKEGAILASNTSTLDLDVVAGFTSRPSDVVGLHFFSPANIMKLLEIVRGAATSDEVLATAMELSGRIGKIGVVAGVCDGFIGNRMLGKYRDQAVSLIEAGATPAAIDAAIEGFGFAMGPFRMQDMAGLDVGYAVRKRRTAEDPTTRQDPVADLLCEQGRYGQKTGGGWYDYAEGSRAALPSPVVDELLATFHADRGVERRTFEAAEIVERLVFALVDEGARIVEEGIALRASDVDVIYLSGYGFPRHRGGPMFYAETVGRERASLRRLAVAENLA